jgi:peroxiredoxin
MANAFTTSDYTAYYEDFAADRVLFGLELEADRMAHLLIAEKEFLAERQVVIEERRLRIEDQPANLLGEVMRAGAFLAHPYRWPVIGWLSDIEGYTQEDLVQYYRTYYAPNNATLIVVGDIKKADLLPRIQTLFGKILRKPDPPKVITVEPPQRGERRVYVQKEAGCLIRGLPRPQPHPSRQLRWISWRTSGGGQARACWMVCNNGVLRLCRLLRRARGCLPLRLERQALPGEDGRSGTGPVAEVERIARADHGSGVAKAKNRSRPSSSSPRIRSTTWAAYWGLGVGGKLEVAGRIPGRYRQGNHGRRPARGPAVSDPGQAHDGDPDPQQAGAGNGRRRGDPPGRRGDAMRRWRVRPSRAGVVPTLVLGLAAAMAAPAGAVTHYAQRLGLQPPKEEVEAPDFTLKDLTGRKVRLTDFRGKVVFLNFFATWCVPCRAEMPAMERLHRNFRDKGLVVLAVDIQESARTVRPFMRDLKLSFPALLDEDGSVAYMYSVRPVPATYLISRDGRIVWRAFGSREWDNGDAREYFSQLLSDGKR